MKLQIEEIIRSNGFGELNQVSTVTGGDINDAYKVETEQGVLFLKVNDASQFPNMFEAEKQGLLLLIKV